MHRAFCFKQNILRLFLALIVQGFSFSTLRLTLEFYDILSMIRKAKGDDTDDLEIEALKNDEIKTEGEIFLNIKKIDTRIYRI